MCNVLCAGERERGSDRERIKERINERVCEKYKRKKRMEDILFFQVSTVVTRESSFTLRIWNIYGIYIILLGPDSDPQSSVCYNRWFICLQKNKTNEKSKNRNVFNNRNVTCIFWCNDKIFWSYLKWALKLKQSSSDLQNVLKLIEIECNQIWRIDNSACYVQETRV